MKLTGGRVGIEKAQVALAGRFIPCKASQFTNEADSSPDVFWSLKLHFQLVALIF